MIHSSYAVSTTLVIQIGPVIIDHICQAQENIDKYGEIKL